MRGGSRPPRFFSAFFKRVLVPSSTSIYQIQDLYEYVCHNVDLGEGGGGGGVGAGWRSTCIFIFILTSSRNFSISMNSLQN